MLILGISTSSNIASVALSKDAECIKELNINNNKTEKFLLTKENKQQDNYKIEILLNKKISEDILQNVEIKVYSEQKNKEEVKEWKEK